MPIVRDRRYPDGTGDVFIKPKRRIGKIRKGSPQVVTNDSNGKKKTAIGKNQNFFRFAPERGFEEALEHFTRIYGEQPTRINAMLIHDTIGEIVEEEYMEFKKFNNKAKGGSLVKRCNGESIIQWLPADSHNYCYTKKPCEFTTERSCGCKYKAFVNFQIYEFWIQQLYSFPVVMETGDPKDVDSIRTTIEQISSFYAIYFPGRRLWGGRIILERYEDEVGCPMFEGKTPVPGMRSRKTEYLVRAIVDPEWYQGLLRRAYELYLESGGQLPQPISLADAELLPALPPASRTDRRAATAAMFHSELTAQQYYPPAPMPNQGSVINGEVMPDQTSQTPDQTSQIPVEPVQSVLPSIQGFLDEDTEVMLRALHEVSKSLAWDRQFIPNIITSLFGKANSRELTPDESTQLCHACFTASLSGRQEIFDGASAKSFVDSLWQGYLNEGMEGYEIVQSIGQEILALNG